jgi:hypothetical protein
MTKSLLIVITIAPSLLEIQQRHFVVAIKIPSAMTFSSLIVTIVIANNLRPLINKSSLIRHYLRRQICQKSISKPTYKHKNLATSINKTQRLNPQYQNPN